MVVKNCSDCDYYKHDSGCIVPDADKRFLCPYELFSFMARVFAFMFVSSKVLEDLERSDDDV